ncbi:MAG: DUF364 domain-containing protein [Coriobacteriia bacterium]|nr:DUF364 domain-containing protein [Coriobacteriia bacterium]
MGFYDQLIAGVPVQKKVDRCFVGRGWTAVSAGEGLADEGLGLALSFHESTPEIAEIEQRTPLTGSPLAKAADLARSWGLVEAGIGVAALNAHYNSRAEVESWTGCCLDELESETSFTAMREELRGKKVGVIGHFPDIEQLSEICTLSIFERRPQPGDLPDFAVEYLLPEQDYVFITGATLVNKTMPRLLELSRNACVTLTGPSVPLTPKFFDWGVDVLAGTVVLDLEGAWRTAAKGGIKRRSIWRHGAKAVQMRAEDFR